MADGAHTEQMILQRMAQRLKEMNAQQAELKGELKGEIRDMFSEMKADLLGILKQALKLPEQTTVTNPNPSVETVTNPEPLVETLKNSDPFIEPLKRAPVLQVLDSVPEVLIVHRLDSHVEEEEESSQQSTNGNDKIVAHQLFDQMPNEYQKELTVIASSNKEVLSFSHKDARVWEPGGLPNETDLWDWPKGESKPHKKKSHQIETFEVLSSLEPSRRYRNVSLDVVDELKCNELVCEEDGDSIIKMSTKFSQTYEDPQFELVSLEQSHDPVENHLVNSKSALTSSSLRHMPTYQHRAPFSPYQNQNNQSHYNNPNTTSLLPPLETTKSLPYKPNFPPETNMEKPKILQESGMRGLGMPSDGSYANGNHLEIKKPQIFVMECEGATITDDETKVETNSLLEKETISSSALCEQDFATQSQDFNVIQQEKLIHDTETIMEMGPIQEHESLGLTDSISKVDFVPSQFQVPLSSMEPSPKYLKESLVVISDMSYDLECVISKTNGCICDSEFVGLTESSELQPSRKFLLMNFEIFMNPQLLHDKRIIQALLVGIVGTKEKIYGRLSLANYVWKPGELLCVQDQRDWLSEVHSGELQEWNDVAAGHFLLDMVEKGNYLDEVIEEVSKTFTLAMIDEHKDIKTACVFLEMSLNLIADQVRDWSFFGLLLQWKWHPPPQATSEFLPVSNDKPVFSSLRPRMLSRRE